MVRRRTRSIRFVSLAIAAVTAALINGPSLSATSETAACATVDVALYKSPCGLLALSSATVAAGTKLKVVVEVPTAASNTCGGGRLQLSASFATPSVLVDGKEVTSEQATMPATVGEDPASFTDTIARAVPKPEPGRRVSLEYGRHVVEFTIDPKAPDCCLRMTKRENVTFAEGPWVVLSGGPDRVGAVRWSTSLPFVVRAAAVPSPTRTFIVTTTRDARDAEQSDGACDVDLQTEGPQCSLRAAIEEANRTPAEDRIVFALAGDDVPTIKPEEALPVVTQPVVIDGTTQKAGKVELDGSATWGPGPTPRAENGLVLAGGKSTVRGLVLNRFPQFALVLRERGGNTVEGNVIGLDRTGTRALGNGTVYFVESGSSGVEESAGVAGVGITAAAEHVKITGGGIAVYQSGGNRIGGTRPAARNLIAGNIPTDARGKRDGDPRAYSIVLHGPLSSGNIIEGNWFGLQQDGETMVDPGEGVAIGLHGAARNKIGGVADGAGNRIAARLGIVVRGGEAVGNVIEGNDIDFDLLTRARTGDAGIWIAGAKETLVGGDARNLISGFAASVRLSEAAGTHIRGNFIGANADGLTARRPAGHGIVVSNSRQSHLERNVIAFNDGDGVMVERSQATRISRNSIFSNGQLGINLVRPGNVTAKDTLTNEPPPPPPPVVRAAVASGEGVTVRTEVTGRGGSAFVVEDFANRACDPSGFGEGQHFLAARTVPVAAGAERADVEHALPAVQAGAFITATMTTHEGATEFSRCVQVMGVTDCDGDGVSDDVEAGAANGGDGNRDGTADARQANVVSLPTLSGVFVTIAAPNGTLLTGLGDTFLDARSTKRAYLAGLNGPRPAPPGTSFPLGLFHFAVRRASTGATAATSAAPEPLTARNLAHGVKFPGRQVNLRGGSGGPDAIEVVALYWPPDPRLNAYWNYGPTPDARDAHWYPFAFDGTVGARLVEGGASLHVADGGPGDHDLEANGSLVLRGGPGVTDVSVSPTSGPATGGTTVSIKGRGFTRATTVAFGGVKATSVKVVDERLVTAVTAPHAAGVVDVVIATGDTRVTLAGAFTFVAPPATATADDDGDQLSDQWEQRFSLDARNAGDGTADPDGDGRSNVDEQRAGSHPRGFHTRYLAEGASSGFFDVTFALANPGGQAAAVLMRFQKSDGTTASHFVALAPMSRATVHAADIPEIAAADFSTIVESDEPVVIDRTMKWNDTGYGSHAETSLPAPATTWYLAEGATHSGFNLFYLVQNPGEAAADVEVTYLRPQPATPIVRRYTVTPSSRHTIFVNQIEGVESSDVSAIVRTLNGVPIIVERAMYLDAGGQRWGAGHASAAVAAPSTRWFLAEGATGSFFDLFVLIANPSDADADVRATYLLPDGQILVRTYTVARNSRFNIWVDQEGPELADTAVSVTLESVNAVPIIVERSMWWPGPTFQTWQEAHNSPGATAPAVAWALADGELGGPRATETYVLIANTSDTAATVQVTLLFEDATTAVKTFAVPASSRFNVNIAAEFAAAAGRRFGALVESLGDVPALLVVERAMYSNAGGVLWSAGTNALGTPVR